MPEVTLVEAINLALARALQDDPDVVVLGEDVGVNGGVFRATRIHSRVRAVGESELRRSPGFDAARALEAEPRHGVASRYGVSARGGSAK